MIYVQLRARVKLAQGETLHVADAANVLGSEKAGHCSLFCPTAPGVYTLDAIAVAKALKKVFPQEDISLIGADVCYVHRIKARGKDFLRPVRTAAALLILLLGSALGLTWFHADVNMPQAQADARALAYRYAQYAQTQGVCYSEVIVNPSHWKNIGLQPLLCGVLEALC